MYKGKKILCIIPARGSSKGLPGKNIKKLLGKPLIIYSIEDAKESRYIDKIIVSTDSIGIARMAGNAGAEVPFIRPKELARDESLMIGVLLHSIKSMEEVGERYDLIVLLQPTSPLRTAADIDGCIKTLFSKKAEAVVSVSPAKHTPYWSGRLSKSGCMKNFQRMAVLNKNRQCLPVFYRLNGAVYIARTGYLLKHKTFFGTKTYAYKIPVSRSIDIDDLFDFEMAGAVLRFIRNEKNRIKSNFI